MARGAHGSVFDENPQNLGKMTWSDVQKVSIVPADRRHPSITDGSYWICSIGRVTVPWIFKKKKKQRDFSLRNSSSQEAASDEVLK